MADTLLFRGGDSASIAVSNVQSREIVIDTDTDQIVSGTSKKKTVMEQSNGDVNISGKLGVGIGYTPGAPIHTKATGTSGAPLAIFDDSGSGVTGRFQIDTTGGSSGDFINLSAVNRRYIGLGKFGSPKLVIDNNVGNVLIGGTLPSAPNIELNGSDGSADFAGSVQVGTSSNSSFSSLANTLVAKGTGNAGITVSSGSTSSGNIFFADNDSTSVGRIQYEHNGDYMRFYTGNSERLRIDGSGSVSIGGTLPSAPNIELKSDGSATFSNTVSAKSLVPNYPDNIGSVPEPVISLFRASVANATYANNAVFKLSRYSETGSSSKSALTISLAEGNTSSADVDVVTFYGNQQAAFTGDITCTDNSKGLILKSPDGTSFRLSVANDGTLSASSI